jgi:glycine/D-amino acid oxidase-like deaminating enzyme/nitrite reductase/ring-hydroxylating ferredoxin subunit
MESSGTTVSVWMDTNDAPSFPALPESMETDVVIVGAGMAGLSVAYNLTKAGKKVVVIDKGPILSGETERTTAHLSNELDDRYYDIERIHGEDGAKMAAASHGAAIDFIERVSIEEKIDCGFRRVDGYLFLGPDDKESTLDKELEAAHRAGLTDVEKIDRAPLEGKNTGVCLRFPNQGQFHPTRYLSGLAKAIIKNGGQIFAHTKAEEIEEDAQPVKVKVTGGKTITATTLIVATNAPVNDNAAIYTKQAPYRTYVVGINVPKGTIPHALYWDTLDPYHYVRLTEAKDDKHEILIVGGEDHKTGEENDMDERYKSLEKWAHKHFPGLGETVYRWSGQVFETIDGLAMIGQKPGGEPWSLLSTGDSGMGMTHGTIAGMLLTDLAQGKENEWEELYKPGRFHMRSATEFIKENADVAKSLVQDWVKPSEEESPEKIKPGSGAVMRKGATKIALYRDPKGEFHACSAVCPHKGCIVQWNDGEKSWDCPCHGSRYNAQGEVLTGPTIKNLEPMPDWNK